MKKQDLIKANVIDSRILEYEKIIEVINVLLDAHTLEISARPGLGNQILIIDKEHGDYESFRYIFKDRINLLTMGIKGTRANLDWAYLDEHQCFTLWNEEGSLGKALKKLKQLEIKNPKTDKPPTKMSVAVAAKRYAVKNPEEARLEIANAEGGEWAEDLPRYWEWLLKAAQQVLYKGKFAEWVIEHKDEIRIKRMK